MIDAAEGLVTGYTEKPTYHFLVSMGVYVFEPSVLDSVPAGRSFDLPDLIQDLLSAGKRVASYLHTGYWLDIGRPDDYEQAQQDYERIKPTLLPRRHQ